jgi:hypothetical protein
MLLELYVAENKVSAGPIKIISFLLLRLQPCPFFDSSIILFFLLIGVELKLQEKIICDLCVKTFNILFFSDFFAGFGILLGNILGIRKLISVYYVILKL